MAEVGQGEPQPKMQRLLDTSGISRKVLVYMPFCVLCEGERNFSIHQDPLEKHQPGVYANSPRKHKKL